jgi:LysW-gamma-L-lysine/LysW-L-ornithine aminotransferase
MIDAATAIKLEQEHYAQVYQKLPVVIDRGQGALVWDIDGKEYVDCMAGYGVALVGHCNPRVVSSVKDQADRLITCHPSLYNTVRSQFLERLSGISPRGLDQVFLSNSGAEANECAIKLARKHTGRKNIIAFTGSFHGKTMGAVSVTWAKKYREPFEPLVPGVHFAKFGEIDTVKALLDDDTAAVIVEPVQGESGVHIPPDDFLPQLRELCDENNSLLIFDEIQSGLGRTGKMWAGEHWNVTPDVVTIAKGLAGGLPIGATLSTKEIMSSLKLGEHSSTFGGNPLCCAAGSATIDCIVENRLPSLAEEKGALFDKGLQEIASGTNVVREIRGLGLMLALETRFEVKDIILESLKQGLLTLYSGRNIIRLLPPLVIEPEQIEKALTTLGSTLPNLGPPLLIEGRTSSP